MNIARHLRAMEEQAAAEEAIAPEMTTLESHANEIITALEEHGFYVEHLMGGDAEVIVNIQRGDDYIATVTLTRTPGY